MARQVRCGQGIKMLFINLPLLQTLHILQDHYVETLGRALVVNLPMILNFFYKGISPFLDPVTRDKVGNISNNICIIATHITVSPDALQP